ncbi:hypothetical protein CQ010_18300 [Arthrobacter sp. MYb211]|nr:hypothetical protein CQ015_18280 [Arthrobacter sp. MYb221]PRC02251.1 hypothetical protein CQ010_18300 [Arthrobacter sp. MYb211]
MKLITLHPLGQFVFAPVVWTSVIWFIGAKRQDHGFLIRSASRHKRMRSLNKVPDLSGVRVDFCAGKTINVE